MNWQCYLQMETYSIQCAGLLYLSMIFKSVIKIVETQRSKRWHILKIKMNHIWIG